MKFLTNSVEYFLWKNSDFEKNELIDIENRYNSSYNFYEQYFNDISKNEVDFDLIMFWNFLGSFLYKYFSFTCTSIFFLIVNSIILAFIGGFDYLDIDIKTHKYTFFQILYVFFTYIFLWIGVGCSSLLSQQIFIDSFEMFKKSKNFGDKSQTTSENDVQNSSEIQSFQISQNNLSNQKAK